MPTPSSANILCGTGEVWFNRQNNDGTYAGFRHLGNVSKLDITPTVTVIEKKSSMNATRAIIARAVTEAKMELAMILDEFDKNNVALALLGSVAAYTQAINAAIVDTALGNAEGDFALDTGLKKIVVSAVKHSGTPLVLGTDYTVDSDSGLITVIKGGGITDGWALTWSGSNPAIASYSVNGLTEGKITGALRYRSSTDQVGPRMLVDVYNLSLSPDSALALLGDTFAEIPVKGSLLPDSTRAIGDQVVKVTYL
jgi:hypothetical protein